MDKEAVTQLQLSGRASGGPLFYPIAQLRHVDLLCNLSLPLYIYILLFLCAISHILLFVYNTIIHNTSMK